MDIVFTKRYTNINMVLELFLNRKAIVMKNYHTYN